MKTVYMVVTNDEYELPALVTENVMDIARMFNTTKESIFSSLTRGGVKRNNYRILRVKIDED